MEILKNYQLDIMLMIGTVCGLIALFIIFTKTISLRKKLPLIFVEFGAMFLLFADRLAYIYRGNVSQKGYWMVRISNFLVFFLTIFIIYAFNYYLSDLIRNGDRATFSLRRLRVSNNLAILGIILIIVSQFTGFYYTFDEWNQYQRGKGFFLCYLIPIAIFFIQFSVIVQFRKMMDAKIAFAMILFTTIPIVASIVQFIFYGWSFTNLSLGITAIILYFFVIKETNDSLESVRNHEIEYLKNEQKNAKYLFDQTSKALVNAIDAKDSYTQGHSVRVALYSKLIAEKSGKSEKECNEIYYTALLHDVGKIGIPDYIINKVGKLSDEEYEIIKRHPSIGGQILSDIDIFPNLYMGAKYHHERYDGKGYPDHLKGEEIPDIARIIAVADAYDAMTSKRSYRNPFPQKTVREEIFNGIGTQFDPVYAKIMLQMIDEDENYQMKESVALS